MLKSKIYSLVLVSKLFCLGQLHCKTLAKKEN